jgi:antitoxin MazE
MKAKLVRIGNSRGVRIPKPLIDEAGFGDDVELLVSNGVITISKFSGVRCGWAEAAREVSARGEDGMLDADTSTAFDEVEWQWN